MAFTEFSCRSGGSNLNAGTLNGSGTEPGTSAAFTYASGNWVQSTGVFTVASGDPSTDGVSVGDFASVYADGSTTTGFVGRITAVSSTTIEVSLTAKSGTAPTDGTGNRTIRVGGAWQGPNGASAFPFAFITNALTNTDGNLPRVNLKNDQTYSITSSISHSNTQTYFSGYTSTYGDGGKFTLDAGTSAIVPLILSGVSCGIADFCIQNNGTTGTSAGFILSSNNGYAFRGVVNSVRGNGFNVSGSNCVIAECEAYNCNKSNVAGLAGFSNGASPNSFIRCISHDHTTGSNGHGFTASAGMFDHCISDSNAGDGFRSTGTTIVRYRGCDAYNNTGNGFKLTYSTAVIISYLENCNAVKNGGYGVVVSSANGFGYIINCGFGAGTQANSSGNISFPAGSPINEIGTVNYASDVTPWVDPANGDFRINLAASQGSGRGSYQQTASGYAGTVAYPDIGSAQSVSGGGGGTTTFHPLKSRALGPK